MANRKQEEATCTFHYLVHLKHVEGKEPEVVPFTSQQFKSFCDNLLNQSEIDLDDDETRDKIKRDDSFPVEQCELLNDRTLFGRYRARYTGHSYENTDVGEIPEDSVSLRPFFFIAYISEGGRIYIGSQYLGQFGGYVGLVRTLRAFLPQPTVSYVFRHDATSYRDVTPKAVKVNYSRMPKDIADRNKIGQSGAMTFKPNSKDDVTFQVTVMTKILARIGESDANLRTAVADMLNGNEMLDIREDDIEGCSVIAMVDGKKRTINVIEAGNFATRFPLEVDYYIKGHPDRQKSKAAMLSLLEKQIISRSERV